MSDVIEKLKASSKPLENDLAIVLEHWQSSKREQGLRAGLGYEPRDINAKGAVAVISARVLKVSSGFEHVDPELSYEAIVEKYPDQFEPNVREVARERLKSGGTKAMAFRTQDIQFFIKTSLIELFEEKNVVLSSDEWVDRKVKIPDLLKRNNFAEPYLSRPFRSLIWLHENEKMGERGRGLTACVQFGPMDEARNAKVREVEFFDRPVGKEFLDTQKHQHDFIDEINRNRHTKTWPVDHEAIDVLLTAVRKRVHQFAAYETEIADPNDDLNLEKVTESTALRQVISRRNQGAFRRSLLSQRPNRCAISGTDEVMVLEAAHIIPYAERFADRDKSENGMLLRSDIHKLFDAHLISINPETRCVEVSEDLTSEEYAKLKGRRIDDDLSPIGLKWRYDRFISK